MPSQLQALITNPKKLFLIDGIGAFVSAFFLGVVLVSLQKYIGLPKNILYVLAIIPVFFAVYSFSCYFFLKKNQSRFLKDIAIANLLYCCTTISLLIYFYQSLTILGLVYFILELLIVVAIIRLELKAAQGPI